MGGSGFDGAKQLPDISDQVSVRVLEVILGDVTTTYIGRAKPGAVEADSDWAVQRTIEDATDPLAIDTTIEWAIKDGKVNSRFVHAVTDMTALTYG